MTAPLTAQEFLAESPAGWRVDGDVARATFGTASFATGVALLNRIADLAEDANHHPDLDLRYASLTVRLTTHDAGALTRRDVDLATAITAAAADLGLSVEQGA